LPITQAKYNVSLLNDKLFQPLGHLQWDHTLIGSIIQTQNINYTVIQPLAT